MTYPKSYSELIQIKEFVDRYRYLRIAQNVGDITFGHSRYLNQIFYMSDEWKRARREAIIRDKAHDLAMPGGEYDIRSGIYVHHINPITLDDILNRNPKCYDLENLVCTRKKTHDAIHYGDEALLFRDQLVTRTPNDMCPWK